MRPKKFVNIEPIEQHNSFKQFTRWRQERMNRVKQKDYSYTVPNVKPELSFLHNCRSHKQPSITWVGHSTFLLQVAGLNLITDPVWSGQMAFQKRLAPPGIPIEDVPPIDVVLISHSHYDHLNIQSLRRLGGRKQLLVPAGLSSKLKLKGFANVKELHWWESVHIHGVKFTFVPSQHWTRRNPWDSNSSHWGGWVIEPYASSMPNSAGSTDESGAGQAAGATGRPLVCEAPTIYFAGDSGYFQGFKEIGRRFDIDVALMPIGAYEPEWFMGPQHVTPEEALQAFEDTGAKWFVPMHYGAFKLADDTPREALDRLEAERAAREIEEERIVVLPHGETWKLAGGLNHQRK
ncbi:MBL fold metallo-hydrolase [Paenibacillus radicis (ex Gao et al. 2016)]|uniref:Membrane protein n=1 Tax=Paenibacillus radicis (ex Gao et al. 2016) TaxID=1737354 RepID=A0A917H003_9BACL|nr:MBL fold metallo-hydrolase [Paenibacillus radicis (ex Gao et al. 2016)]GGG63114.1 membrane protein [Paenibacillus radicis (ex Gao et al. 2016)]